VARTNPESEIQSAICDYLAARHLFFIRLNNIPGLYIDTGGTKRFRKMGKYARRGMADILVIKDGRPTFLEVKTEKAKPTKEQINFGSDAILAGASYFIVRSIDDVQKKAGL
jgi:hypothetical protein